MADASLSGNAPDCLAGDRLSTACARSRKGPQKAPKSLFPRRVSSGSLDAQEIDLVVLESAQS